MNRIDIEQISVYRFIRLKAKSPFLFLYYNTTTDSFEETDMICSTEIENNSFNQNSLAKAGFAPSFVLLFRPDNYIGYIAESFEREKYNTYLRKNLLLL